MFKTLLCIPPDYDYNFPPLGTPALCAFLKERGIDVSQVDLNLKYRDFLIRHISNLSLSIEEKKVLLKAILKKFFREKQRGRYYSDYLARDSDGIFPDLPYDNNTNSSFYFTERLLSSEVLWRYLEDKKENTFYQFYWDNGILDYLEKEKINLLGISIISPSQAVASLTLGHLVKKHLPHIHVSIGGQWPTLYRRIFLEKKEFFKCFDSIVVFEGETPLLNLVRSLKNKKELNLTNVILRTTKVRDFRFNPLGEDMNKLPCPDFGGLPLVEYDATRGEGKTILTYETSRGCYWSKCAYCVDLPLPKPSYRRKDAKFVVRDIRELKRRYNAGYLLLGDPALSARQMLEVSEELLKKRVEIGWWTMARLEPAFNYKIFKNAHRAGLSRINFGFESANNRVCAFLDKGNLKERSEKIIKDCHRAGIEVDLQTMLGLPGETFDEGLETIDFLLKNKDFIARVTFNVYYLTPSNFIYQNPAKYGIEYERDTALPFRFFVNFRNPNGMSIEQAYLLEKIYYGLLERGGEKKISLARDALRGIIEFKLNGESSRISYLRDKSCGEFFLVKNG